MKYLIFSKETNEFIDVLDFEEKDLNTYLLQNNDHYAEEAVDDFEFDEDEDEDEYSEFAEENWN